MLVVALGTGAAGSASAAEGREAVACTWGHVCLRPLLGGRTVMVPAGQQVRFGPALRVTEVTNASTTSYCVGGDFGSPLGPGQTQTYDHSVSLLTPVPPNSFRAT